MKVPAENGMMSKMVMVGMLMEDRLEHTSKMGMMKHTGKMMMSRFWLLGMIKRIMLMDSMLEMMMIVGV